MIMLIAGFYAGLVALLAMMVSLEKGLTFPPERSAIPAPTRGREAVRPESDRTGLAYPSWRPATNLESALTVSYSAEWAVGDDVPTGNLRA